MVNCHEITIKIVVRHSIQSPFIVIKSNHKSPFIVCFPVFLTPPAPGACLKWLPHLARPAPVPAPLQLPPDEGDQKQPGKGLNGKDIGCFCLVRININDHSDGKTNNNLKHYFFWLSVR